MGIEMWFKDDVRNILISANASSATTAEFASGPVMQTYRLGYQAALMTVALACGIPPDQVGIRLDALPERRTPGRRHASNRNRLAGFGRMSLAGCTGCIEGLFTFAGCAPGIGPHGMTIGAFGGITTPSANCKVAIASLKAGQISSQLLTSSAASIA